MSNEENSFVGKVPSVVQKTNLAGLVALDAEQEQVGRLGCDLVNRLFILTKNTLLFDLNNDALDRPVEMFLETLNQLNQFKEDKASIGVIDDNLFLNQNILKPDPGTYKNGMFLHQIFKKLRAQEFCFDTTCEAEDIRAFMEALRRVMDRVDDPIILSELRGFKIVPLSQVDAQTDDMEVDRRIQVLRVFAASIATMARVMALANKGAYWSPNLVRRVAYDIADAATREPDLLLGLIHIPVHKSRIGAHLVRTGILAFRCAEKLNLPRKVRAELVMIALYHHLSNPPGETRSKVEQWSLEEGQVVIESDPLAVALALCFRGCLNESMIRRAVGAYETAGYIKNEKSLYHDFPANDLLGRIISICDRYANLVEAICPDEALRVVLFERQKEEPGLLRILVNAVGLYPVGTMVKLESGARAIVVEAPRRKQQFLKPVVQIIDGDPALIDLSQDDRGHGKVVGSIDPLSAGVNVSHYFLL